MAEKLDYKKKFKELYMPKTTPSIVQVPEMVFFMVNGKGDPNTDPSYQEAVELLYGLSYTVKMSKMKGEEPEGYFEYVVPPLEGLWDLPLDAMTSGKIMDKSAFTWVAMIRQPEFVTKEVFEKAKERLQKKRPELNIDRARLESWEEGLCAQVMHLGPYDEEGPTVAKLMEFTHASGYEEDFSQGRHHHEIYMGDPRKTAPEKLKTVIRHPIRKKI